MSKTCSKCKINAALPNDYYCKGCRQEASKQNRLKNPEKNKTKRKAWYDAHPNYQSDYQLTHKEEKRLYDKQRFQDHKNEIIQRKLERRRTDPLFKLSEDLRSRLRKAMKAKFWFKDSSFSKHIGCTLEELKVHIEKQWLPGMTWENHTPTGWHVDHIIPLASATTPAELIKLCHYTNLQPLWAEDNLRKSDKI